MYTPISSDGTDTKDGLNFVLFCDKQTFLKSYRIKNLNEDFDNMSFDKFFRNKKKDKP